MREEWRRQMNLQLLRVFKALRNLLLEGGIAIKPRDFIFVLVGHQLEEHVGHCLRQAERARTMRFVSLFDLADQIQITLRVGRILIGGQLLGVEGNLLVDGKDTLFGFRRQRLEQLFPDLRPARGLHGTP